MLGFFRDENYHDFAILKIFAVVILANLCPQKLMFTFLLIAVDTFPGILTKEELLVFLFVSVTNGHCMTKETTENSQNNRT